MQTTLASRLVTHVRSFDEALAEAPLLALPSRVIKAPVALLRARWAAPNGGTLEIVVTADGWVHLDNHAGIDAICTVYRHLLALDPRFVIFDPEDGRLYDEPALRRELAARDAATCAPRPH